MKYDVFLSYNSRDFKLAERLAHYLNSQGIKPFLADWHVPPGQDWVKIVEETLYACGAVVVLIGPHDMGFWHRREMYMALARKKNEPNLPVIPVLLPGAEPPLNLLTACETWLICVRKLMILNNFKF